MLDRTQAPPIYRIQDLSLPEIEDYDLPNGRKLYVHHERNTEAFKVELVTNGGNIDSPNAAFVQLGMKMLNEGTKQKNSSTLSSTIDGLGSFLEISPGFDSSSIAIYGLKKFYLENIRLLSEIIYESGFDPKTLDKLKSKQLNKYKLNLQKSSYISSIGLRAELFKGHPYGYTLIEKQIADTDIADLKQHWRKNIQSFDIYISGDLPDDFKQIILDQFVKIQKSQTSEFTIVNSGKKKLDHRTPKFIQSSIKAGKTLFNRHHPDYFQFIVMNELFGGFFGSRLMKNIREDKGYTYGIYSSLLAMNHAGYFLISTDVKKDFESNTIEEIKREILELQNALVSKEELQIVKNYMLGSFVNSFSSPFAAISKFKLVNNQGLELSYYQKYLKQVPQVTAEQIQGMAQKYLELNSLTWSIAGS